MSFVEIHFHTAEKLFLAMRVIETIKGISNISGAWTLHAQSCNVAQPDKAVVGVAQKLFNFDCNRQQTLTDRDLYASSRCNHTLWLVRNVVIIQVNVRLLGRLLFILVLFLVLSSFPWVLWFHLRKSA